MTAEERRKFVRVKDLQSVKVKVKNSNGIMELVEIRDMSLAGINFYSTTKLEKEHLLDFKITLSDSPVSLYIKRKVLWQLSSLANRFATGVRFNHSNDYTKERLTKFIYEHVKSIKEGREFIRCALDVAIDIVDLNTPHVKFVARSIDISHGGMKLVLAKKVDIGANINLSFSLSQDNKVIEFKARVVWVRKEMNWDGFVAGIIYTEIAAAVKNKIVEFIDSCCNAN